MKLKTYHCFKCDGSGDWNGLVCNMCEGHGSFPIHVVEEKLMYWARQPAEKMFRWVRDLECILSLYDEHLTGKSPSIDECARNVREKLTALKLSLSKQRRQTKGN